MRLVAAAQPGPGRLGPVETALAESGPAAQAAVVA